jgi:hypothetical protein
MTAQRDFEHQLHLLVQFHILQYFNSLIEITQEGMQSQQANKAEISQHFVQRPTTKFSGYNIRIIAVSISLKM